jgi:hypothetical protein
MISKEHLSLQGEGGDGGGVNIRDNPTPILTFLKGKGLRFGGSYAKNESG